MSPFANVAERIFEHAQMFNADVELRRLLLATERKPIPFITIMQLGLQMQADSNPFESPIESQGVNPQPLGE